jgi:dienelactone hydrolase
MTEVVLFHHVLGLTDGVRAFADELRAGGHVVHTPDLFEGARPATIQDGIAHVTSTGEDVLQERAHRAIADLPDAVVYAGFSWGAATAQQLAQTRPGALGALLYDSCLPIRGEWAVGPWPEGVPVQVHGMERDPIFSTEGDLAAARELVDSIGPDLGQLFLYPGDSHLFADSSLPTYDPDAAALTVRRSLELLDRVG